MFEQLRQQFVSFWQGQSSTRKVLLIGLLIAAIIAIVVFINWANTPSYAVAFSGLSEADAGQIVEQLATSNIPYKLQGSGTILVPSDQVYDVRLQMARNGLPQGESVGYEIFSGNSLGMTEFTQRINYQRAMEGELERTIGSLQAVEAVRVHIVTPEKSLLTSQQDPATASVTMKVTAGQALTVSQVKSVTHLVASSVEGLQPENVVVVDVNGNLLASGQTEDTASGGTAAADTHRAAEAAYAAEIENNVRTLLDTVLGPNSSVVKASVSMDWTEKQTTTQAFDPESGAVRSSQIINESYTTNGDVPGGVPGAETNLPTEDETITTTDSSASDYSHSEEVMNYELTQTETLETTAPGMVSKISLSVMVDGVTDTTQLESLQTAITAAAGIDTTRGDVLAVESLAFDHTYLDTQSEEIAAGEKNDLYWRIGEIAAVVLVVVALLWYIQRLLSNLKMKTSEAWTPVLRPVSEMALTDSMAGAALPKTQTPAAALKSMAGENASMNAAASAGFTPAPPKPNIEERELQKHIAQLADENPASIAEIIHLWLSEDEHENV